MVVTIDNEEYNQGLQELQRQYARDALRVIVARAEGTEFVLAPAGSFKEVALDWDRVGGKNPAAAILEQINILQTAGTAGTFDVEIRAKTAGTALDLIWSASGLSSPYINRFAQPGIAFLSEEAAGALRGKIYLAIQPVGGTFTGVARVYARPGR